MPARPLTYQSGYNLVASIFEIQDCDSSHRFRGDFPHDDIPVGNNSFEQVLREVASVLWEPVRNTEKWDIFNILYTFIHGSVASDGGIESPTLQ